MISNPAAGRSALPRPGRAVWAALAVGAFAGAEARYGLVQAFPARTGFMDWTTLGINTAASLALGFLTSWWLSRPGTPLWLKAALGPGFLGSFSTFSALALTLDLSLAAGRPGTWLSYLALSLVCGLAAAAAGLWLGTRTGAAAAGNPRHRRRRPDAAS